MPLAEGSRLDRRLEKLYALVAEDEDSRVCRDLDEGACRWVPRNFFVYLSSHTLTKLGDALASPKTVLTWVLSAVGAPAGMIALLVPIRESGSMLPQLVLGGWVRRRPRRKPVWIIGSLLQAVAVLGCAAAAGWLNGTLAGGVILGWLVVFALARSLNSMASKDVVGKTIPKGRRGRLGGLAAGLSGGLALAVGVTLAAGRSEGDSPFFYALLLAVAGLLWILAVVVFSGLREEEGETGGGGEGLRQALSRVDLLRTDGPFRGFVISRALLMGSALAGPFYVTLAREEGARGASLLGSFLVAGGLASTLAAPCGGSLPIARVVS